MSSKSVGLGLEWLKMANVLKRDQQYIQKIKYSQKIRKYRQASFVY